MIYVDDVALIVEMWAGVNTILARDREEDFGIQRVQTQQDRDRVYKV